MTWAHAKWTWSQWSFLWLVRKILCECHWHNMRTFRHPLPKVVRSPACSTHSVASCYQIFFIYLVDRRRQTYLGSTTAQRTSVHMLFATSAWWYDGLLCHTETSRSLLNTQQAKWVPFSNTVAPTVWHNVYECGYYSRVALISLSTLYGQLLFVVWLLFR